MFRDPSSSHITDRYIALRLLTGEDETAETYAWTHRHDVGSTPSMLVLDAEGRLIDTWSGFRELDDILTRLVEAERMALRLPAEEKALRGEPKRKKRELAWFLARIHRDEEALPLLIQLVRDAPVLEDQLLLARVASRNDDVATYKAVMRSLIASQSTHQDWMAWRMNLAMADVPEEFVKGKDFIALTLARIAKIKEVLDATRDQQERAYIQLELGRRHEYVGRYPDAPKDTVSKRESYYRAGLASIDPDPSWPDQLELIARAVLTINPRDEAWERRILKILEDLSRSEPDAVYWTDLRWYLKHLRQRHP